MGVSWSARGGFLRVEGATMNLRVTVTATIDPQTAAALAHEAKARGLRISPLVRDLAAHVARTQPALPAPAGQKAVRSGH